MPSIAPVSAHSGKFARVVRVAVLIGCGVAVVGCAGAVETVRSLRGVDKNDPDPVAAPFAGNMAAAQATPYPNLASVPPPPSRVTTAAERRKLAEKLVAERETAQAAGAPAVTAAPAAATAPAPPPAAVSAPPAAVSAPPPAPARLASATPQPTPALSAPADAAAGPRRAAAAEPNPDLPRDSELRMPQVRSLPEPDDPRPAPPPPRLRPVPSAASPTQLPAAAIASAAPQLPPPVPEFTPIAPPPVPSLAGTEPPRAAAVTTVAMLDAADPGRITQVASRYKESAADRPPRAVRVIAYTAPPASGADPLGLYHDALQRAQEVAKALSEAGIPEKTIQTEAKPAAGPLTASRIEIQFLP